MLGWIQVKATQQASVCVEERADRDRVLGAVSRSYRALLTPGLATEILMGYLQDVGLLRRQERTGD